MSRTHCSSCGTLVGSARFCGACGMSLLQPGQLATIAGQEAHRPLVAGVLLAGRYRVEALLAIGSMGAIYRVQDHYAEGHSYALKELLQQTGTPEELAEAEAWFRREGETLAGLRHPAIPQIHATFSEESRHYLVMELVEGATLESVLAAEGSPGLPEEQVTAWADQILDVLSYLHSLPDPVVFRDLKPANIMLAPGGSICLIDFGIARIFTRKTPGTAIGTPGYAPPEQYQGLAEPASDLYALGATMHHLLSGRDPRASRPFHFPPVRQLAPWLSEHMARCVDRSLVLDPRRRFDTAADMYRALHATTPLVALPRLTVASAPTPLASSTVLPPLPSDARVSIYVGPSQATSLPGSICLADTESRVTFGGVTLIAPLDRRTLALHNHTDLRMSCAFASGVPWLCPDRRAAWLEPHGLLEICLDTVTMAASSLAGSPVSSSLPVVSSGPTLSTAPLPILLHVDGAALPVSSGALSIYPGLLAVSFLGLSTSTLSFTLTLAFRFPLAGFFLLNALFILVGMMIQNQWRKR